MIGVIKLWLNESLKLIRQPANKVIIIIALVISILIPFAVSSFSSGTSSSGYEYYMEQVQFYEDEPVWQLDYIALAEMYKFFEENNVSEWKQNLYFSDLNSSFITKLVCENYLSGKLSDMDVYDYFYYLFDFSADDEIYYYDDNFAYDIEIEYSAEVEEIDPNPKEEIAKIDFETELVNAKERIAELESEILSLTIKSYAENVALESEERLKDAKLLLSELSNLYDAGKATLQDVNRQKVTVESLEFSLKYAAALENASSEDEDWMLTSFLDIATNAQDELVNESPMSKEQFLEYYGENPDMTYEEYVEDCEELQSYAREVLISVQYSLDNRIPLPQALDDSTKSIIHLSLNAFASVLVIVVIILTASVIAGEYSQGTIRLLLIRPRTRTKIILSKFLALLSFGIVMSVLGIILVYATASIANGVNDAFVPDILYSSRIIEVSALFYSVMMFFLSVFSGILLVALAFMLAVVTRRTMVSIVLPIIVSMASSFLQIFSVLVIGDYPWLRFTPLPYFGLNNFVVSPVDIFSYSMDVNITEIFFGGTYQIFLSSNINLFHGVFILGIYILALFVISFVAFNRQQIKS